MRRLFNTNFNNESVHFMLLVLRVAFSIFMLTHGYMKLQWVMAGGEIQFGDPIGIGAPASLYLAVFAEVFCSVLLILGLASRFATIPLIITMLVAAFIVHAPDPFAKKEMAYHFLTVYVFLLVSGPGKYSIDHFISRSLSPRRR
jgi:putative oxidoreductase